MSSLVQYEPFVDEVINVFLDQTEKLFVTPDRNCDFGEWLQFFAFDVIGQMTYSKRHGFIDRGEDVDGIVQYLGKLFSYVAPVSKLHLREGSCGTNTRYFLANNARPGRQSSLSPSFGLATLLLTSDRLVKYLGSISYSSRILCFAFSIITES